MMGSVFDVTMVTPVTLSAAERARGMELVRRTVLVRCGGRRAEPSGLSVTIVTSVTLQYLRIFGFEGVAGFSLPSSQTFTLRPVRSRRANSIINPAFAIACR